MIIIGNRKINKEYLNILIFFLICFLSWSTLGLIRPLEWDEGVHIYYASNLFKNGFITWDYTHGPMIAYILNPLIIFLNNIILIRLTFAIILICLLSLILYLIKVFESASLSIISVITFSLSPAFFTTGTRIRPDFLFNLSFLLFLYYLDKYISTRRIEHLVLTVLFFALSSSTKEEAWVFGIPILSYTLAKKYINIRELLLGIIPFSLIYIILWTGAFRSIWTLSFAVWQLLMWIYLIVTDNSKAFSLPINFYLKYTYYILPIIFTIALIILFNKNKIRELKNGRLMMFLLIWLIFAVILYTFRSAEYLIFNLIFPTSIIFILFLKNFYYNRNSTSKCIFLIVVVFSFLYYAVVDYNIIDDCLSNIKENDLNKLIYELRTTTNSYLAFEDGAWQYIIYYLRDYKDKFIFIDKTDMIPFRSKLIDYFEYLNRTLPAPKFIRDHVYGRTDILLSGKVVKNYTELSYYRDVLLITPNTIDIDGFRLIRNYTIPTGINTKTQLFLYKLTTTNK